MFNLGAGSLITIATLLRGVVLESQDLSPGAEKTFTQIQSTAQTVGNNEELLSEINALSARIRARRNTPTPVPTVPS